MQRDGHMKSFVFFSRTGCFLPLLIILNLLFGWIFLRPIHWILTGAILILVFIINSYIVMRKILSPAKRQDIIDIEGEVVEDRQQLK
jgi:uncharacterized membrane protein